MQTLFTSNRELAAGNTGDALCALRPKLAGPEENESALHWLSADREGHRVLQTLLSKNGQLASQITGETLCNVVTEQTGMLTNTSALYWLSCSHEGQIILQTLLNINDKLTSEITVEAFFTRQKILNTEHNNMSAFLQLCRIDLGRKICGYLIERNDKLKEGIVTTLISGVSLTNKNSGNKRARHSTSQDGSPKGKKQIKLYDAAGILYSLNAPRHQVTHQQQKESRMNLGRATPG